MPIDLLATALLPFAATTALIVLLARLAPWLGLLDEPDERKRHDGAVPLVGGLAMVGGIALTLLLLDPREIHYFLVGLTASLALLGVIDDRARLSARLRLLLQVVVTGLMIGVVGLRIDSVGDLFGSGAITLAPILAITFTLVCTAGVVNAINMIDGVDGLAGSILLTSFGALAINALDNGIADAAQLLVICCSALLAFLLFNARLLVPRARVFMGDAGSMAFGFILLWCFLALTQGPRATLSPVAAGWIFGVPLLDTVAVIVRRVSDGRSPLDAGREHIHHLLLDSGVPVNRTLLLVLAAHVAMAATGLWLDSRRDWEPAFFWGFVAVTALHFFVTPRLIVRFAPRPSSTARDQAS